MALRTNFDGASVNNISPTKSYIVDQSKCSLLNVRKGPSSSKYASIGTVSAGTKLTVSASCRTWYRISDKEEKWVSGSYLKLIKTDSEPLSNMIGGATAGLLYAVPNNYNTARAISGDSFTSTKVKKKSLTESDYESYFTRYKNTFGSPFTFLESTDPHYFDDEKLGKGVGRAMISSMFANPSVFSICPGKVNYLPNFGKGQKNEFFDYVQKAVTSMGDDGADDWSTGGKGAFSGKLYEFQPNYDDYINRYNVLARACAILLGIGDEYMPGTKIKLANYDYSWYTTASRNTSASKGGFLDSVSHTLNSAIGDDQYIHFFLTNEGSAVSEDWSTSVSPSPISGLLNNSKVNEFSKTINYLFGGLADDNSVISGVKNDLDDLVKSAANNGSYVGSFVSMFDGLLKGGRMVVPDMIDTMEYKNAVSCRMKFISIYGDKLSIFLQTMLPTLAILNFIVPKQLGENMYTYPYIVRCFQQGWYNTDLAVLQGLRITRGGSDDLSWTIDGLSTEIEVTFDIVPLYSSMMSASSRNPYLFLSNTPLLEYLGNLCGVDLKLNNMDAKVNLVKSLVGNYVTDIPGTLGRRVTQGLSNKLRGIFNFD